MPQGVGHDGDATRAIATNEPHDGERHEGKPGQQKQGSCHKGNGVSGPGATAATAVARERPEQSSSQVLGKFPLYGHFII